MERHALARVYGIDRSIRSGRYPSARALAEEFEVSRRTIERDIELLRDTMGAPVAYDRGRGGYFYTDPNWQPPPVSFTGGELLAVFLGTRLLRQAMGTPYEQPIRSAIEKIRTLLPAGVSVDLGLTGQAISFGVDPLRGDAARVAEIFAALTDAVRDRRTVSIRYYTASRGETTERDLDPYHVRYHDGAWYVIGYCHNRRGVRIFALDRIERLQPTVRAFPPPVGFDVDSFLADAWSLEKGEEPVDVAVRFAPRQARYIRERVWHPSQRLEDVRGGGLILRAQVSGLGEFRRWVLQWGAEAEVIEPPALREAVAREALAMARRYGLRARVGRTAREEPAVAPGADAAGEPH